MTSVILGQDAETGQPVTVSDQDRCGGLYLLGKPRTGKSNLMLSLALQDMEHGHGLLFIDPHADAVDTLLARIPFGREKDVILLDPTVEKCAFSINPLTCSNPRSYEELTYSYGLARDVFVKVFGDPQTGELGILLDKYLSNSLQPLLENPGYTLADIWLFLKHKPFRNHLLQNVRMNREVVYFWQGEFEQLSKRDKDEQIQSTLNRLNPILTKPYIKHIVGQAKTTIDFTQIIKTRKIVLLRIPPGLDEGIKTFIGTLVISQLLKAVWLRQVILKGERELFAIYCDEFQHFATPDFARLFTQTGKFMIMPTVAHQERLGQFKPQDPNRGATLAAPNKVLFSLSVADSRELAPEFAKAPPTETRLEPQYIVSQNPVADLLRSGHSNPEIRAFVKKSLRPLQYKLEDTKDEMEFQRLVRMDLLDQVALDRIDQQETNITKGLVRFSGEQIDALDRTRQSIGTVRNQTTKLFNLFNISNKTKLTLRSLNIFFTEVMEGSVAPGQESFSSFLIERVSESSLFPKERLQTLALYISLSYGDPCIPRTVSYALAKIHGLLSYETAAVDREHQETIKRQKEEDLQRWRENYSRHYLYLLTNIEKENQRIEDHVWDELNEEWKEQEKYWFREELSYWLKLYLPLMLYPNLKGALKPYFTACFASQWVEKLTPINQFLAALMKDLDLYRAGNKEALERKENYLRYLRKRDQFWSFCITPEKVDEPSFGPYWKNQVLDSFQKFIKDYGEGALVALILLDKARNPWTRGGYGDFKPGALLRYAGIYNMQCLPGIANRQPLEVALFLNDLAEIMSHLNFGDCRRGYWTGNGDPDPYKIYREKGEQASGILVKGFSVNDAFGIRLLKKNIEGRFLPRRILDMEAFRREWFYMPRRPDIVAIAGHNDFIITYLERRAFDLASYGEKIANLTFPEPVLKGVSRRQIKVVVIFLQKLARKLMFPNEENELKKSKWEMEHVEKLFEEYFSKQLIPLPESLAPRVLAPAERQALITACRRECAQAGGTVQDALVVIEEFVKFCSLLRMPENHIKVRTGQYIDREVNTRSFADMEVGMAWELANLPQYTASVKVAKDQAGKQVLKSKIKTYPVPPLPGGQDTVSLKQTIIDRSYSLYYRKRGQIEEEIWERHKDWLAGILETSPPTHTRAKQKPSSQAKLRPGGNPPEQEDEPPATSFSA